MEIVLYKSSNFTASLSVGTVLRPVHSSKVATAKILELGQRADRRVILLWSEGTK